MKISIQNYESLLIDGGYSGTKAVSQATGLLCLSLLSSVVVPNTFYNDDLTPLTDAQIDELLEDVARASDEIMRNVSMSDFPIGFILSSANHPSVVDSNWLPCDGDIHLRSLYPELYDALDTPFIIDADTFVTPDLNEKFILGALDDIGDTGGEVAHEITISEMPQHIHSIAEDVPTLIVLSGASPAPNKRQYTNSGALNGYDAYQENHTGGVSGALGSPHNNMPPHMRLRYWIRCQ